MYLDLDYVCLRPLDDLIQLLPHGCEVGLVRSTNNHSQFTNSVCVSRPRAAFWIHVITAACQPAPWWAITRHAVVFATTGPLMLNRAVERYDASERIHTLRDVIVPCNVCNLAQCQAYTGGAYYLLPIVGNSWHAWDSTTINWLYCNMYMVLFVTAVLMFAVLMQPDCLF